jgi:hypothetical protein
MDFRAFLTGFVRAHPGTRLGRLFGAPAAFAGRRAFARLSRRGLEVRTPGAWLALRPRTGPEYLRAAYQLECAARSAAMAAEQGPGTRDQGPT